MPTAKKRPDRNERDMTLEEWLSFALVPAKQSKYSIVNYQFPTDRHRDEYLLSISERSEADIRKLLRNFLISSGTLGIDRFHLKGILALSNEELTLRLDEEEYARRLLLNHAPWEGITWVLDLLPHYPGKALDVLDAYFIAHCQCLPDGRIHGLCDAEAIIRARYIHWNNSREALLALRPGEFELLVGALYKEMGYKVTVTRATQDGGVDVIAEHTEPGTKVVSLIQCKRYDRAVSVHAARELNGVVSKRHANKGIIVTTSRFTRTAKREAAESSIIELIDFSDLNKLLNQYFGSQWPVHMSYRIRSLEYQQAKAIATEE